MKVFLLFYVVCPFFFLSPAFSQLPIKPARTISFTTDEGTNMNVDISPDGKTIAFDLLGDIYLVPSEGGTAKQITKGLAIHRNPAFSYDGKKIAYESDASGELKMHVMDTRGKNEREVGKYDSFPLWSFNGNYITSGRTTYALAGGSVPVPKDIGQMLRYSTDKKYLYHYKDCKIFRTTISDGRDNEIAPVPYSPDGPCNQSAISPDGGWISYVRDSNYKKCLVVKNIETGNEKILVTSLFIKYPHIQNTQFEQHFNFTSDSKYIFIGYGGKIHRIEVTTGDDKIIPFIANIKVDAGAFDYNTYRVSNNSFQVKYTRSANASPDGKHIVFEALNKIYVMDLPNGRPHVLTDQPFGQFQPAYSFDGRWICYISWNDTIGGFLWRVPSTGGTPQQLTKTPAHYQYPCWSPEGKKIAVVKTEIRAGVLGDYEGSLVLISIDDGNDEVIDKKVPLPDNQPFFSSEGNRLFYRPAGESNVINDEITTLASIGLNDQNRRKEVIGNPGSFQWIISPDNRYITWSQSEDIYLLPIDNLIRPVKIGPAYTKIRFGSGVDPHWEKDGKILSWSYGVNFYRIDPDKIVKQAKEISLQHRESGIKDSSILTVSIKPDQTIKIDITAPGNYGKGIVALMNARLITMEGEKIIERGTLVIKDGRIIAEGKYNEIRIPQGAQIIDLSGKTIMPGFIDLHLHMNLWPVFPLNEHSQQSWKYLANLAYGVTTARDPGADFNSFGIMELLKSGQMIGPRLFSVGRPVSETVISRMDNIDDARSLVQKRKELGATYIKQYDLPARKQRQWLLLASKEAGLNMTNEGDYPVMGQIGQLKNGSTGIEHRPDWGDVYGDMITLFAKSKTFLTPTLQVRSPGTQYFNSKYWHQTDDKIERFLTPRAIEYLMNTHHSASDSISLMNASRIYASIRHAGGNVTLGSHGDNQGTAVHSELWALQVGGLTNLEALQSATIMGAEALGMQKDLGSIKVGKIADLIILNKNPLDDIHNSREIKFVMKDGILYDGDTLDEIWPEKKKCPEWRLHNTKNTN